METGRIDVRVLSPSNELGGQALTIRKVPGSTTVIQLKRKISTLLESRPSPADQRIICNGRMLGDGDVLGSYFLSSLVPDQRELIIHLLTKDGRHQPTPTPTRTIPLASVSRNTLPVASESGPTPAPPQEASPEPAVAPETVPSSSLPEEQPDQVGQLFTTSTSTSSGMQTPSESRQAPQAAHAGLETQTAHADEPAQTAATTGQAESPENLRPQYYLVVGDDDVPRAMILPRPAIELHDRVLMNTSHLPQSYAPSQEALLRQLRSRISAASGLSNTEVESLIDMIRNQPQSVSPLPDRRDSFRAPREIPPDEPAGSRPASHRARLADYQSSIQRLRRAQEAVANRQQDGAGGAVPADPQAAAAPRARRARVYHFTISLRHLWNVVRIGAFLYFFFPPILLLVVGARKYIWPIVGLCILYVFHWSGVFGDTPDQIQRSYRQLIYGNRLTRPYTQVWQRNRPELSLYQKIRMSVQSAAFTLFVFFASMVPEVSVEIERTQRLHADAATGGEQED